MAHLDVRGKWVLVTGASSGLGRELALQLARHYGANVAVTARREERLNALAAELETFGVQVNVFVADLADKKELNQLIQDVNELNPRAAILNAGVTYYGHHMDMPEATLAALLQTNIRSTVRLSEGLVPSLQTQYGGLLLVSSVAGIMPLPYQAAYSGTKAFVLNFGLALAEELRDSVSVTVFAPGGVATEMLGKSGLDKKFSAQHPGLMSAERCAQLALQALKERRTLYVPGTLNKLSVLAARLLPRDILSRLSARLYSPDA